MRGFEDIALGGALTARSLATAAVRAPRTWHGRLGGTHRIVILLAVGTPLGIALGVMLVHPLSNARMDHATFVGWLTAR